METKRILLADIVTDAGTQVRVQPDEATVADYAHQMTDGATFPPVVLFHDGNQYFLADGFHRVLAARRNDWRDIDADVRVGTKADALWFALSANRANGRRLTQADKKHAILLAFQAWPEKSAGAIAEQVGCAQDYVSQLRSQVKATFDLPDRVVGKDGKNYPVVRGAEHPKAAEVRERIQAGETTETIRQSLGVSNDIITKERRCLGLSVRPDSSRAAIAQRRKDIADMAARGFATRQIAQTIGIDPSTVSEIAKKEGIVIHADRVVAGTRRIDANRVVEQTVMDAENLTADVDLVAFDDLDPAKFAGWIESLKKSQRALGEFVKRLIKEQSKHGQAA